MWNARRQANTFWENNIFKKNPFFAYGKQYTFCVCEFDGACAYAHEQRQIHTSVPCDRSLSARRQFCGQTCYRMSTRRFSGYNCCPFSFSCWWLLYNFNHFKISKYEERNRPPRAPIAPSPSPAPIDVRAGTCKHSDQQRTLRSQQRTLRSQQRTLRGRSSARVRSHASSSSTLV